MLSELAYGGQVNGGTAFGAYYGALGKSGGDCEIDLRPDHSMICLNGKLAGLSVAGLGGHESRYAIRLAVRRISP